MALHQLLSMIPHEVVELRRAVLARWTDSSLEGDWEEEPSYGAFVDETGMVVSGSAPAQAFLESDDPRHLELAPGLERSLGGAKVFFLDWARQPVSFEEIFDLWEAWESQGMIAGCGAVSVSWALSTRWTAPSWVAFREDFDGSPLSVIARGVVENVTSEAAPAEETSFLARALRLKGETETTERQPAQAEGDLPMLPFTIASLKDPHHAWPVGVV